MSLTTKQIKKLMEEKFSKDAIRIRREIEYLILFGCKPKKETIFKNITE